MFKLFIVAKESEQIRKLSSELVLSNFTCSIASDGEDVVEQITEQTANLVLISMDCSPATYELKHLIQSVKKERHLPVIALLPKEALESFNPVIGIDDFVVEPWDVTEVVVRIKRILGQKERMDSKDIIKCGDLVIDLAKCEVSLGGKLIMLTFKEYQLLNFLTSNQGKVFTREALLNKVWGWDYYGGDRTVDVHIRRLRSKIEDRNHSFIDTVRNIGYKFIEGKKGERTG
ncbi:MAG: response regulator transcription factor [Chloroflexota bacterium]|nr:response regulator transcription factor [Chloroflexota bacterium]